VKPEPNELINGIRDVLRQSIAPELTSGPAVAALRRIMVILKETDWNETSFLIAKENRTLAALLQDARAWAMSSPRHGDIATRLDAAVLGPDEDFGSFRAVSDRNAMLRRALADFISVVARDETARDAEAHALRRRMATALARPAGGATAGSREERK
jgi:hypothetical protein